jgi:hypothetical protein
VVADGASAIRGLSEESVGGGGGNDCRLAHQPETFGGQTVEDGHHFRVKALR